MLDHALTHYTDTVMEPHVCKLYVYKINKCILGVTGQNAKIYL